MSSRLEFREGQAGSSGNRPVIKEEKSKKK